MNEVLHKFPSTPHLAWLGRVPVRDDKVMTPAEAESFLSSPVVLEEKVDGANLGLSFDTKGRLLFQNRGAWLEGRLSGQWERLRAWAAEHGGSLRRLLPSGDILFGEWCYAAHSIRYDRLPDWFLAFDVYDAHQRRFWSASRRNALAATAGLAVVPELARGGFTLADLWAVLHRRSELCGGAREGLYLRREHDNWLVDRAKLVRPDFTQGMAEHWSRQPIRLNKMCPGRVAVRESTTP
ncbi:MAG: hypothetical protein FJ387_10860 [Verrucomicrobia bacterium]|nr:hypothetical protein [Verrucomicrobiota bacterium]